MVRELPLHPVAVGARRPVAIAASTIRDSSSTSIDP
jgi:hypothetical protein